MASEKDRRDPSDNEAGTSEGESVEGSDAGAAEAEPEVAAARHNYNLRPKRKVPDNTGEPAHAKKNEIAPGVGLVADHNHVGGPDIGDPLVIVKDRVEANHNEFESQGTPVPRGRVVDRSGGVAWNIPVPRAKGRTRLSDEETDR